LAEPLVELERLAARAAELAPVSERDRQLAAELVHDIARARLWRLCVPESLGGLEAAPTRLISAVETLARGDASAGWCVAVCATSGLLGGYLPEPAAREIFGAPTGVSGGVFAPKGRAQATMDGFRVSGRWPFGSGCEHCGWLMCGCIVYDGETPRALPSGRPDVRLVLVPADDVVIHDTWHVSGLRGTGSHDISVDDLFVPVSHTASVFTDPPVAPGPLYAFPLFGLLAVAIAGVALGVARAALSDVVDLAGVKTPTGSGRKLAERAATQVDVARAEASLRAARGLLYDTVGYAWEVAVAEGEVPVDERASLRLAATHATTVSAEVVDAAWRLAGASAAYETSPLQRRFRDIHVATQHMLIAPATWELTGRLLLGLATDTAQL
jgi:indole-3-acetate monooxygenase